MNWLNRNKNKTAIIFGNDIITYENLYEETSKLTVYLSRLGIKKGNIVTILSENNPDFIFLILSLWELEAIPVPINFKLPEREIIDLHKTVNSDFIFIHNSFKNRFNLIEESVIKFPLNFSIIKPIIIKQEFNQKKTALILFTSGTVNKAKGVLLTFGNLISSADKVNNEFKILNEDTFLASLPFFHIGGFSIIVRMLLCAGQIIIPKSFKTFQITNALKKYNPTIISLVPTMLKRLVEENVKPNSKLRITFIGGGPANDILIEKAVETGWPIVKVYGSTETSSMIAYNRITNKNQIKLGARLIGDTKILIQDQTGNNLQKKEVGEIVIEGETVAKGYYNGKIFSLEKFKDGKYFSNDLGYLDEFNLLHLIGRKDDIIISGGEKINPIKIEYEILKHPEIQDTAVFGIDDKEWGQKVIAVVVKNSLSILDKNKIQLFLKDKVASFEIPKEIFFIDSIPKTTLGKIKKEELKKIIFAKRNLT